jgi:hypothetical protein
VLFCLLLFEGASQIYLRRFVFAPFDATRADPRHYYQPSSSPLLAYELRPGKEIEFMGRRLRINRWGIREPDDDLARERWRVALLGDSVVFGVEHSQERTLSSLLQDELDPTGQRIRVLNFGLGGLNLAELVEWLRLKDAHYDVDEVVLLLNPNDYARRESIYEGADNGLYRMYRKPLWMGRFLVRKAIYRFMKGDAGGTVGWYRWLFAGNERWGEEQLRALARYARESGIELHVVLLPSGHAYADGRYLLADQQERLSRFLAAEGIRLLDPAPAFAGSPEDFDGTDHLRDGGNQRMAREMARFLRAAPLERAPRG